MCVPSPWKFEASLTPLLQHLLKSIWWLGNWKIVHQLAKVNNISNKKENNGISHYYNEEFLSKIESNCRLTQTLFFIWQSKIIETKISVTVTMMITKTFVPAGKSWQLWKSSSAVATHSRNRRKWLRGNYSSDFDLIGISDEIRFLPLLWIHRLLTLWSNTKQKSLTENISDQNLHQISTCQT